jgi:hypothetical protein
VSSYSMASAALARRPDVGTTSRPPRTRGDVVDASKGATTEDSTLASAVKLLTTYIPTDVLSLYIAGYGVALAIQAEWERTRPNDGGPLLSFEWWNFWLFLVLTPVITWVVFATKLKADGKSLPLAFRCWPLWEMIAGAIAYTAWTIAIPESPFDGYFWHIDAATGFVAVFISFMLGLFAPLFQRQLPTA